MLKGHVQCTMQCELGTRLKQPFVRHLSLTKPNTALVHS